MNKQNVKIQNLKIAFIGIGHWHFPLYLPAVEQENLNVVAVSDNDASVADRYAARIGCKSYTDVSSLLDIEKPDFVFAFAIHSRMPELAMSLIARNIPFAIEKPLGVCASDVIDVRKAARKGDVFCAIPLVWRNCPMIRELKQQVKESDVINLSFRFIAGPPERYLHTSPWMLKSSQAGGGCMTNLGVHFIDLALYLTGSTGGRVKGTSYHYSSDYDVEDYASALIQLESGASLSLEIGYAYPMDELSKRDNRWNIVVKQGYYTLDAGYFETRRFESPTERIVMDTDNDSYYAVFVIDTLRDYLKGRQPLTGLDEMLNVRRILDQVIQKSKG